MFRFVTELKGLAVDIDSLIDVSIEKWIEINKMVSCVFFTSHKDTLANLEDIFGEEKCIFLAKYEKVLAPNRETHIKVIKALGVKNSEMAYVSGSHAFLEKANGFLSGSIWITDRVSYPEASNSPDMIRKNVEELKEAIRDHMVGFFGEMVLFPFADSQATMLPVEFEVDGEFYPFYMLGRYFGYSHYMNQLHPYSSAIFWNKRPGKNYTGICDPVFEKIYYAAIRTLKEIHGIDCICSVPVKPNKTSRFDVILEHVANSCDIQNVGASFICTKEYADQKTLFTEERERNVRGVFKYSGDLSGHTVVLIDDIASTGSTVRECVRELKRHGADEVVIVVLAVNQIGSTYWSSDSPQVNCPICKSKMSLFLNGSGQLFYSCTECFSNSRPKCTFNFNEGWKQVNYKENEKTEALSTLEKEKHDDIIEFESEIVDLERSTQCPYCSFENSINIDDISNISWTERTMGFETLYEFNEDINCEYCEKPFRVKGYVSIYPENAINAEEIIVEKIND